MTAEPPWGLVGAACLLAAAGVAARRRLWAGAAACVWVLAVVALTACTLVQGGAAVSGGAPALRLLGELALAAGLAACVAAWARAPGGRAFRPRAVPLMLAVLGWTLGGAGVRVAPVALEAPTGTADEAWVVTVRQQLRAAAAGDTTSGLEAVTTAAERGADVATLRALCPTPQQLAAAAPAAAALCRALSEPLAEEGAQQLGCGPSCTAKQAPALTLGHRCRLAAELYAEAGDLPAAQAALAQAGPKGRLAAAALYRARQLPLPAALAAADAASGELTHAWPDARALSPTALGFALTDAPGELLWHPGPPGAPAPGGVLHAHSPYRTALVTHVPVPLGEVRPAGVDITVLGQPGLAITLTGAQQALTYRCPAPGPPAGAPEQLLPAAACQEQWVQLRLVPAVGAEGIQAASIGGEFLLAAWRWRFVDEPS